MTARHHRRMYSRHRRIAQAIADGHNQLRKLAHALPDLSLDQIRSSAYYLVRYGMTEIVTRNNRLGAATYGLAQPLHVILEALGDQDREFNVEALSEAWGVPAVRPPKGRRVLLLSDGDEKLGRPKAANMPAKASETAQERVGQVR